MEIILNARKIKVQQKELTYSMICDLVNLKPSSTPTVTYSIKGKNEGGSLVTGTKVEVVKGLIVNAMLTNNG